MSFASELALVLPSLDPTPGADRGDRLRLIKAARVRPYLRKILPDIELEAFRATIVRRKTPAARAVADSPRQPIPGVAELIGYWSKGDTATIVRLRNHKPIRMVFMRREARSRVRVSFLAGGMDRGWTIEQALFDVGIRRIVSTVKRAGLARLLLERGYERSAENEYVLKFLARP